MGASFLNSQTPRSIRIGINRAILRGLKEADQLSGGPVYITGPAAIFMPKD